MKTMVDNVCTVAIEAILVSELQDIFSPSAVMQMDEEFISSISTESEDTNAERERLTRQCAALQSGLDICRTQLGHWTLSKALMSRFDKVLIS
jgi:hypothetical protein